MWFFSFKLFCWLIFENLFSVTDFPGTRLSMFAVFAVDMYNYMLICCNSYQIPTTQKLETLRRILIPKSFFYGGTSIICCLPLPFVLFSFNMLGMLFRGRVVVPVYLSKAFCWPDLPELRKMCLLALLPVCFLCRKWIDASVALSYESYMQRFLKCQASLRHLWLLYWRIVYVL